jgi:hypothetical protein
MRNVIHVTSLRTNLPCVYPQSRHNVRHTIKATVDGASVEEGRQYMSSASVWIPRHHMDDSIWKLLSASSIETQEVASELPANPKVPLFEVVKHGFSLAHSTWKIRSGFRRLASRQGQVIGHLSAARFELWPEQDCSELALLMDDLIHEERDVLKTASAAPVVVRVLWGRDLLSRVDMQVSELQTYCHRLDALSLHEEEKPGDQDMRDFVKLLESPEEFDFSLDGD